MSPFSKSVHYISRRKQIENKNQKKKTNENAQFGAY